jgi:hypothetical protein
MSTRVLRNTALFAALSAFAPWVSAQDFWMQRSYTRWTRDEIIRIISDSPWAQVAEVEANATDAGSRPMVTVRLRSAVPIRQALVRLKQIEGGYDKLDAAGRAELDARLKGTLDCPACQQNYVVTISPPISKRRVTNGVYGLKGATFKLLEGKVYLLTDTGEKRPLVHFVAPKSDDDEATFFFARRNADGKPLVTASNTRLVFVFDAENIPIIGGLATTERRIVTDGSTPAIDTDTININKTGRTVPRRVEFDARRLLIDGLVEF